MILEHIFELHLSAKDFYHHLPEVTFHRTNVVGRSFPSPIQKSLSQSRRISEVFIFLSQLTTDLLTGLTSSSPIGSPLFEGFDPNLTSKGDNDAPHR